MENDILNLLIDRGLSEFLSEKLGVNEEKCRELLRNFEMNNSKNIGEGTITITFGEVCENHVRMQQIGKIANKGFSIKDLESARENFTKIGCKCEMINLCSVIKNRDIPNAKVLVVRNGVNSILGSNNQTSDLFQALKDLEWDKKAKMYGRVVDKKARFNICFADEDQNPNYEKGEGTVVSFSSIPLLSKMRKSLGVFVGPKAKNLFAEGNWYYDNEKCGIGYHGDTERRRVIALRFGESSDICFQWFEKSKPVGKRINITLNHGDLYIMSEKAVGTDWKKSSILTLRHAVGEKFVNVKK